MTFIIGNLIISGRAAVGEEDLSKSASLEGSLLQSIQVNGDDNEEKVDQRSSILSTEVSDDKEYLILDEPLLDVSDIQIDIKVFTFDEFDEGKESEQIDKELGYTVNIKRILLDPFEYEDTVESELDAKDYHIAYLPYRETSYIVKAGMYYQNLELSNGSKLLSFNDENIGILSNNYLAAGLFYNKSILEEAGLEDPMVLLDRGQWNLDNFYHYLEKTSIDRNDDGLFDIFGIVINEDLTDNLAAANGTQILSLADDGSLSLQINDPGFKKILDFINKVYSNGFKGGMAKQGFIDGRACFYNDDASVYTQLNNAMEADIGFISYPSDIGLIKSASSKVEIAVVNKDTELDEVFLYVLDDLTKPRSFPETYFESIFEDQKIIDLCIEMTKSNYVSPIHMFKELNHLYLDMLRDVKAGFSVSEMVEIFSSGSSAPAITYP